MAGILSAQLNATPGCIPSKWTRNTIADGDWLQAKTLNQYSTRDNWLAEKIEELSGKSDEDLEKEIQARIAGDTYLSGAISSISSDFYPFSANVEISAAELNTKIDNEIDNARTEEGILNAKIIQINSTIDTLKAASDVIMVYGTYNDFQTKSATLTLTDNDVIKVLEDEHLTPPGQQVYYQYSENTETWTQIGELSPYYSKAEIESLSANLSSTIANTYLSANGTDISAGKNLDVVIQSNNPRVAFKTKDNVTFDGVSSTTLSATTAYGSSAKFDNISAATVTALTATGNSAKFTNISATNISANLFKSDLGTVDTLKLKFVSANGDELTANSVNVIQLTAGTLYGQSYNSNVDSLICSAENGQIAYDVINNAKFSAVSTTTSTAYISGGFGIKAGNGVGVSLDGKNVVITAEGTTYNAGNYISTANKTISVTGNLIGSAQSGKKAYDYVTNSATFHAGPGIGFYSAGPNLLGISAEGTKVSAGGNINNPTEYTTNVNLSAGGGVQFVTADNNVLGIKTTTMEYSPYNYSTYSDMTSFKINAVSLQSSQQYESVVIVNDKVYGFLMPEPDSSNHLKIPVARYENGHGYYYLDNVTAAVGNYVSAFNQQKITIATAASLPTTPDANVYYLI